MVRRSGSPAATPIAEHFDAYTTSLRAGGKSPKHISETERLAKQIFNECGFKSLRDIDSNRLEGWLAARLDDGMAARTRNAYLQAVTGFCGWCVRSNRLASIPLRGIAKADEKSDRRLTRRAMTEAELVKLLHVARLRPLAEFGRQSVPTDNDDALSQRASWKTAPLTFDTIDDAVELARVRLADNPDFITKLELRGRERQLLYKTLLTTGLRKGELASVMLRHLDLEAERAFLTLDAQSEKNRQGNAIPLRADLAADLRDWLSDRTATRRQAAQIAPTIKFDRKARRDGRHLVPQLRKMLGRRFFRSNIVALSAMPCDSPDERCEAGAVPNVWPLDWTESCRSFNSRKESDHIMTDTLPASPLALLVAAEIPTPHEIQRKALSALEFSRAIGNQAGLVVLATGLGKTWLAAFDSSRPEFRRVLFVAHREEILTQAMQTFGRIRPLASAGLFTGTEKLPDADMLFASIQTLGRVRHLKQFPPDAFDYIVVDEFHHAAAKTYRQLIEHFEPQFLLGLCGENLVFRADVAREESAQGCCAPSSISASRTMSITRTSRGEVSASTRLL